MANRTYSDAVAHLNTLQSNAAALEAARASGRRSNELYMMVDYLERLGYSTSDLNKLNVIHITGTKGKGSTSAFVDSILRETFPGSTIGLYTSPHLVAVRERIRINGKPLPEADFTTLFFEVWDALKANTASNHPDTPPMPGYFRFMTLLAFYTFLKYNVDATVLEVGVGGAFDSTNIVPKPVVTGVTALGIDHVSVLGSTLTEIAWQKGGIYKKGVPALTVEQPKEGLNQLRARAEEVETSKFVVVQPIPAFARIKLGLAGVHQYQNAMLAAHLAHEFVKTRVHGSDEIPPSFEAGLRNARWPGRCQTVADPKHSNTTWYLDGAHTTESLDCCIRWFVSAEGARPNDSKTRVLIFNCTSGRSGPKFLGTMLETAVAEYQRLNYTQDPRAMFEHVIFCTNVTYSSGTFKGDLTAVALPDSDRFQLKTQHQLAAAWKSLYADFPRENVHVLPTVEDAVHVVQRLNQAELQVLVCGSLHLVGGIIEVAGLGSVAL
ncbi:FolC bifunctional protein [Fistulina hepatica ATCC 64428]|nr:FolC bifunctional protein [Fistulina hepatica ATCC 64428]